MKKTQIQKSVVQLLIETVMAGLKSGVGIQIPGRMCVEAAVCYAFGEPHGDKPICVGSQVRDYGVTMNDCIVSSDAQRSKMMIRFSIAQLGSAELYQGEFSRRMAVKTINRILPRAFRLAAESQTDPIHKAELNRHADLMENAESSKAAAARAAADNAGSAAYAARAANASNAAYAAADAAADAIMALSCELAVEVLTEMKSPGVEWLHLIPTSN
jgi:hypothetical protein